MFVRSFKLFSLTSSHINWKNLTAFKIFVWVFKASRILISVFHQTSTVSVIGLALYVVRFIPVSTLFRSTACSILNYRIISCNHVSKKRKAYLSRITTHLFCLTLINIELFAKLQGFKFLKSLFGANARISFLRYLKKNTASKLINETEENCVRGFCSFK